MINNRQLLKMLIVGCLSLATLAQGETAESYGDNTPFGPRPIQPARPAVPSSPVNWHCTTFRASVGDDIDAAKDLFKAVPQSRRCQSFDPDGYIRQSVKLNDGWFIFADRYGKLNIELRGEDGQAKHLRVYMSDDQGNVDPRNSRVVQTSNNDDLSLSFRLQKQVRNSYGRTEEIIVDLRCRASFRNRCQ
jgi:hypothetical protein